MSKPKFGWYPYVTDAMRKYPDGLNKDENFQAFLAEAGIRKACVETSKKPDGEERLRLISMVYFKNTHSIPGAAMQLSISERTAQRWSIDFVYLAAHYMGYR